MQTKGKRYLSLTSLIIDEEMSEENDPKSLVFSQTLPVPIIKDNLFNAVSTELWNLFPPLRIEPFYFNQDAWNYSKFDLKGMLKRLKF